MFANFSAMLTLAMESSGLTAMHLMDGASRLGVAGKSLTAGKSCRALLGLDGRGRPSPHKQKEKPSARADGWMVIADGSRIPSHSRSGVQRAALPLRRVGYSREWSCSSPLHRC